MNLNQLEEKLSHEGVNTSEWGNGSTKSLKSLQNELLKGECVLELIDGILTRVVRVVGVDIFYENSSGDQYNLRENKQVFNNGSERVRDFEYSVGEKMEPNELPLDAIHRGIQEELGIMSIVNIVPLKEDVITKESTSYPGLMSQYIRYWFNGYLTGDQFHSEGYVEKQDDKKTYFGWNKVKSL